MTPALRTNMSSGLPAAECLRAHVLTDRNDARSKCRYTTRWLPLSARSVCVAASPLARSRPATTTRAPAVASARAVSYPRPEAPPVTTASLPVRSWSATTSSAVVSWPNAGALIGSSNRETAGSA
jgi:hypothetical protein